MSTCADCGVALDGPELGGLHPECFASRVPRDAAQLLLGGAVQLLRPLLAGLGAWKQGPTMTRRGVLGGSWRWCGTMTRREEPERTGREPREPEPPPLPGPAVLALQRTAGNQA